jgi:acyl-CoA synthetase (AMP-forming)/AMP-acid ligase II
MDEPRTIVSRLHEYASKRPNDVAVTFLEDGEQLEASLTYAELHASAMRVSGALRALARPGDRVILGYPNGLEFMRAFFACQYAGLIPVPIAPPRRRGRTGDVERMEGIIRNAQPTVLLTLEKIRAKLREGASSDATAVLPWTTLEEMESAAPDHSAALPTMDAVAFLQYTSGSTSDPRGVVVTHGSLVANITAVSKAMNVDEDARLLCWLPLHHDMGLIGIALHAILKGAPLVLMTAAHFIQRPFRWVAAMSRHRATFSGAPNFAYELCVQRSTATERHGLDLSNWKTAFNGAEPVRAQTLRAFADAFGPSGFREGAFFPCYGLAEATLYVSGTRFEPDVTVTSFDAQSLERGRATAPVGQGVELVSCGRSPPQHHTRIVDPQTGLALPDGEVGEIWAGGPSIARGYWNSEAAAAATFVGRPGDPAGVLLRTGDLGVIRDGELFVTGRLKDLLIVRGRNVYPQDVEGTVASCCDALLSGGGASFQDDRAGPECIVIVQELRSGLHVETRTLMRDIVSTLVAVHDIHPERIVLIGAGCLPKTSSGKVRRRATREALNAGQLPIIAEYRRAASAGGSGESLQR